MRKIIYSVLIAKELVVNARYEKNGLQEFDACTRIKRSLGTLWVQQILNELNLMKSASNDTQ